MFVPELLCGIIIGAFGMLFLIVAVSIIYSRASKKKMG